MAERNPIISHNHEMDTAPGTIDPIMIKSVAAQHGSEKCQVLMFYLRTSIEVRWQRVP
jgi:hypothetical protein